MFLSRHIRWLKPVVFVACLGPVIHLGAKGVLGMLGANPIQVITWSTGTWTLVFLCVTLSVTPLRRLPGLNDLIRFRRMFGLFAFFYGFLHLTTYVWLDQFFDFRAMALDIYRRPFIAAGLTAFLLMVPLAVTSTQGMIRRLGGRRWRMLHRLVYASAIAGVIHYYWQVKIDETVPIRFAVVVGVLLGLRVLMYARRRKGKARPAPAETAEQFNKPAAKQAGEQTAKQSAFSS
jgi:methionine sulfoxide reductase heme-binding subunit